MIVGKWHSPCISSDELIKIKESMKEWYKSKESYFSEKPGLFGKLSACFVCIRRAYTGRSGSFRTLCRYFLLLSGRGIYSLFETLLINVVLGWTDAVGGQTKCRYLSIDATATALSVFRGYCFRHWACCLFCLVDISLP